MSEELTPTILIERYCLPELESSWHGEKREHSTWHTGAISYAMCCGREHDGYDDGYEYMYALSGGGWRMMPEYGEWPYAIYMWWAPRASFNKACIASFCEGDFGIEVFDSTHAALAAVKQLPETNR